MPETHRRGHQTGTRTLPLTSMSLTVPDIGKAADALVATAPAKINLTLDVLRRRDDEFHEIHSLAIGIDLSDRLSVRPSAEPRADFTCTDGVLATDTNLVVRAIELLSRELRRAPAVLAHLDKRIPVAAGLGGGSSDAAAALRLCSQLWAGGLTDEALARLGAQLGSDVPLFFSLPAAELTGRGEIVRPVSMRWAGWVLLIHVDEAVPTAPVYRAWRPADAGPRTPDRIRAILNADRAERIMPMLSNDLEAAIGRVAPRVSQVFRELLRAGVGPLRISGAGSTLYRLFDRQNEAIDIAEQVHTVRNDVTTVVVAAPAGPGRIQCEESC